MLENHSLSKSLSQTRDSSVKPSSLLIWRKNLNGKSPALQPPACKRDVDTGSRRPDVTSTVYDFRISIKHSGVVSGGMGDVRWMNL